jgi:peptidoglycan/xylan/chitin deacetylase (PgdA/CDA1 family)
VRSSRETNWGAAAACFVLAALSVGSLAAEGSGGAAGAAGGEVSRGAAMLSIVFDDGYETDLSLGLGIFAAEGCVASSAIITSFVGRPGYLDAAQVRLLSDSGWEIMSHTASHQDLRRLSEAQLELEYRGSIATLESIGARARNLVYPSNKSDARVREAASRFFRSARGGGNEYDDANTPRFFLRSFEIKDDLKRVEREIDGAAAGRRWLILYHHRIMEKLHIGDRLGSFKRDEAVSFSPSGARGLFEPTIWNRVGNSLYIVPIEGEARPGDRAVGRESGAWAMVGGVGCDERELLASILRYAKSRYPGMRIVTVDQGLDALESADGLR